MLQWLRYCGRRSSPKPTSYAIHGLHSIAEPMPSLPTYIASLTSLLPLALPSTTPTQSASMQPPFLHRWYNNSATPPIATPPDQSYVDQTYANETRPVNIAVGKDNKNFKTYFESLRNKGKKRRQTVDRANVPLHHEHCEALEVHRRHNSSIPLATLVGQVIRCRIVAIDKSRDIVMFNTGFKFDAFFYKKELSLSSIVETAEGRMKQGDPAKTDFEVGDVLLFEIEVMETPFREMQLRPVKPTMYQQVEAVTKELEEKYHKGEVVLGRVLNQLPNDSFAVGIAGVVAMCPMRLMSTPTAQRVGVLTPFYIRELPSTTGMQSPAFVVEDANLVRYRGGMPSRSLRLPQRRPTLQFNMPE